MTFNAPFGRPMRPPFGPALAADAPVSPYVVYDTFTDSDGVNLTAHTPDIRPGSNAWTKISTFAQNLIIASNKVKLSTIPGGDVIYVIDSGKADTVITCVLTIGSSYSTYGIVFRYVDTNNRWNAIYEVNGASRRMYLQERTGGTTTTRVNVAIAAGLTVGQDYTMTVTLSGTSITALLNGTTASYTSSSHQAATKHGLQAYTGAAANDGRMDTFAVTA